MLTGTCEKHDKHVLHYSMKSHCDRHCGALYCYSDYYDCQCSVCVCVCVCKYSQSLFECCMTTRARYIFLAFYDVLPCY